MGVLKAGSDRITNRVLQWITWADKDYLAARRLLLGGLLPQGAGLCNTAIEKYLKTIILIGGFGHLVGHDVPILYAKLTDNGIDLHLNCEFLGLLTKAYELRYPDTLQPGYNIHLSQAKVITELDHSVHAIRRGFDFDSITGRKRETWLDTLVKKGDETLMSYNAVYGGLEREAIFREKTLCYELRVMNDYTIMEAEYHTDQVKDDGKFNEPALVPGTTPSAHPPMP
jgi:hypothetical protein